MSVSEGHNRLMEKLKRRYENVCGAENNIVGGMGGHGGRSITVL